MVEDLLERLVHSLRLSDLLDGAAIVAGIRGRTHLRAQDELPHRRQVRQAAVTLHMPEDHIEQPSVGPEVKKSSMYASYGPSKLVTNASRVSSSNSTNLASWIVLIATS